MRRLLFACSLALLACGDEAEALPSSPANVPDAAVPDSASPPATAQGIPLIDWVDDLLDHHTNDTSAPDTVDDKKIIDDEDPTTFSGRF